ncbi:MAG TPA: diguanylate cyclase [Terracidiphilus sp.]
MTQLIVAALAATLFIVGAGALVYGNTQRLIAAANWVQHTQDVLLALQRASFLTERIESNARLYLSTGDEDLLNRARTGANLLGTASTRVGLLVADNSTQLSSVQSLTACANELQQILNTFTPRSTLPELQIQRCQQTIALLTDREQLLLKERNQGSQHSSFTSVSFEIAYVAVSLMISIVLFSFLLRDAQRRQRMDTKTMQANERLAQSVKALEDRAYESKLLTSARDELQLCVDVEQVYQSAANSFSRLFPATSGCLCIMNNSRHAVEVVSKWGESALEDFNPPEACCGLRSGQPRWRRPGLSEIHCTHFAGEAPERYLCRPVVAHGNTLGMIYIQCATDDGVQSVEKHTDGLRQLLQITGMSIATLNLRTRLENQSIRDPLTGLFNRHFMQISLERELSRANRRNQSLAVFMLDLDHFKRFNDQHGHAAGDSALKAIAEIFQSNTRPEDIVCRYGGEEFTIILPDLNAQTADDRAESIRRAVNSLYVPLGRLVASDFAVSIGIAVYPQDGESADLLLQRADQALYSAKHKGRNQVVLSSALTAEGAFADS